jgi:phosphate uptake regulator
VHSLGKQLLQAIEAMRERFVIPAALGSTESAADVLFAARSMMRFQWRDYIGALARIDAFLARNADHAEVIAARAGMLEEGEQWLQKRLRRLDLTLQRGDTGNAEMELDKLDRWVAIPEWQPRIAERRARWQAAR